MFGASLISSFVEWINFFESGFRVRMMCGRVRLAVAGT